MDEQIASSQSNTLNVDLLGGFRLSYCGVPITTFNTPRLQSLFAYLILNRSAPQFRYHLAYTFWPDSTEEQARTNLRNLVFFLRRALPDHDLFIRSNAQTLQWREDAPYALDVLEFDRLLLGASVENLPLENLEKAISIYQGDLLPSCYDDWISPERTRLRDAFLAALACLARNFEESRDYPAAIAYASRLVQADPLHEDANQRLIRVYALSGDRPAALKAYHTYAGMLKNELGLQPDQELQELSRYLKIAQGQSGLSQHAANPLPMVGRRSEWQKVQALWRSTSRGNPHMLFLTGEAGIGKSRLAEEIIRWAEAQGIRTAVAQAYPAEGGLPYAPVLAWLRSRPLPRLEPVWLAEIARLMPEVLKDHPKLAPTGPLTEAWQRQRLFEALARAVLADAGKQLLLVEDLHWCDRDTLEWLHFLLRFDPHARLMVVGTVRSEEAAPDHPLAVLQAALRHAGACSEIPLEPLDESESARLAAGVAGRSLLPEQTTHLFRETEGNPLFIVETVRAGLLDASPEIRPAQPLPEKVKSVLHTRITQLSAPTRELVSLAATIGREFTFDVLRQAGRSEEEILVNGLNELLQRRVVREASPDVYDFSHDKLREAAFAGLSTAHRRLLHRQVAEALIELSRDAPQARHAEIASHYERAGLSQPAIQYYRLAAESAQNIFANEDAIRYFQRAISLAEAVGAGRPGSGIPSKEQILLYERLGDILRMSSKPAEARAAYEQALAASGPQEYLSKSTLYRKLGDAQGGQYLYEEAHASLDMAEKLLRLQVEDIFSANGGLPEERQAWIDIQMGRANLFYWLDRGEELDSLARQIQPYVETHGRIDQRIDFLQTLVLNDIRRTRLHPTQETVDMARLRLALSRESGDPYQAAISQFQLGFALLWHGNVEEAIDQLEAALARTEKIGMAIWSLRCFTYLSLAHRKLGHPDVVRYFTELLMHSSETMGDASYIGVANGNLAWLALQEGDLHKAIQHGQEALDAFKNPPFVPILGSALWPLLSIAVAREVLEEACTYARKLLDLWQPGLLDPLPGLLTEGLHAYEENTPQAALELFRQAVEKAQEMGEF